MWRGVQCFFYVHAHYLQKIWMEYRNNRRSVVTSWIGRKIPKEEEILYKVVGCFFYYFTWLWR